MAYPKSQELSHELKQDLGYDYIEVEFILEKTKESPKVEEQPKLKEYVLSPVISRKELRQDRRKRQKSFIKFERPVSVFSIADSRIPR